MSDLYEKLLDKLDTLGKGYPRTEAGTEMNFIKKIFHEEDAEFFLKMKIGLHTAGETADYMEISLEEAEGNLERMVSRHLLFWQYGPMDIKKRYRMIPYIHGIWEFNVDKIEREDAKNMGYYYMNGFADTLFDYRLPISRVVPINRDTVKDGNLLPFDDIVAHIKKQELIVLADCACRAVAKFGKPCSCSEDLSICMNFGEMAKYLLETNAANPRVITTEAALDIISANDGKGLFIMVGHTISPTTVCSCAKCHCGILMAAKLSLKSGPKHKKVCFDQWGNYLCSKEDEKCSDCGMCASRCPMKAMKKEEDGRVSFDCSKCIGCGLCVTKCPEKALLLERKPQDELNIPEDHLIYNTFDRMATEKAAVDKERLELAKAQAETD